MKIMPAIAVLAAACFLPGCYEENEARTDAREVHGYVDEDYDHLVEIRGFEFRPGEFAAKEGETVLWLNLDGARHTVTSVDGDLLGSPALARGETYSYTFEDAGEFEYMCSPHPRMRGMVIVHGD